MLHYVCKYTPIELLSALGADPTPLDGMRAGFDEAERIAGPNICGFGKTVLEAVYAGEVHELVLTNCCDTIRTVHDLLQASGKLDFLYLLDVPHCADSCARERFAAQLKDLAKAYSVYSGTAFDAAAFADACRCAGQNDTNGTDGRPYVGILGARAGADFAQTVQDNLPIEVRNLTCVAGRKLLDMPPEGENDSDMLMDWYAGALLGQMPCMRMFDPGARHEIALDPNLAGIIYHTVRFCDFYNMEFARIQHETDAPILKIESDYTTQGAGQLLTRVQAFAESADWGVQADADVLGEVESMQNPAVAAPGFAQRTADEGEAMPERYFAGIDSGSTSTDAVIVDASGAIMGSAIIPTGAGSAAAGAEALRLALADAGLVQGQLENTVATGYGREAVNVDGRSVTEITCHARGAHAIDSRVRTIVDIGGQDSKAIAVDGAGRVVNFAMNDKCAAGTGRFLEMMARTLQLDLGEMAQRGTHPAEDITISSTCSVFAESEVVSLIAQGKDVDSIVHGLDKAVAVKAQALVRRVNGEGPFMMTGGVARNAGVVAALSERLGAPIAVDERAQLAGAYGAALIAAGL